MNLHPASLAQRQLLTKELVAFNENLGGLKGVAWNLCLRRGLTPGRFLGRSALCVPVLFMPPTPHSPNPDAPLKLAITTRLEREAVDGSLNNTVVLGNLGEAYEPGTLAHAANAEVTKLLELHKDGALNHLWPTMCIEPAPTILPEPIAAYN
ncbi:MAG TPA: hypothetical protein VIM53_03470 [Candidatus Saccharimonadales bacterium]